MTLCPDPPIAVPGNTGRTQAEEALRESEANFRTFFETIDDLVVVATPEGRLLFANPAVRRKLGYDAEELANMQVLDLHPADSRPEAARIFAAMLRGERSSCPLPLATRSGALLPVETRVWFGRWSGIDCIFGLCKDLSAEQEAIQRFERLFHHNPALLALTTRPDRHFFDVNEAWLNTLGYSRDEVIGRTVDDLRLFPNPDEQAAAAHRLQTEGRVVDIELQVRRKDGVLLDGLFSGDIVRSQGREFFLTVMVDITHRKRAAAEREKIEAQSRQLQKAESLGRLAGAVAHNLNNQLQAALLNLDLIRNELPQESPATTNLDEALGSVRKAAEVSTQMLTYLGQTHCRRDTIDLAAICDRCLSLLRAFLPRGAALTARLPSTGPAVQANASQIQQILANLVANAWEAAPDGAHGIRLAVSKVETTAIPTLFRFPIDAQLRNPAYACLEVADTGCGIPQPDIEKIFDPFFSTKFPGRGMGLAVVLGIVRAHFGAITVNSQPGRGSVFRVYLPLSPVAVPPPSPSTAPSSPFPAGATILAVDDEPNVLNSLAQGLGRLGLSVITARDGCEALEMFQQHRTEIGCVLCDLTMPRMDGWETLAALRRQDPTLPVILSSGYTEGDALAGFHAYRPQAFLGKPYNLDALGDALRRVLAERRPGTPTPTP
jgi:PAS domain S-box-containing protein